MKIGKFWNKWATVRWPRVEREMGFYGFRIHRLFIGFVWSGEQR